MDYLHKFVRNEWFDDHLLLFQYAKSIHDESWALDILNKMHHAEYEIQHLIHHRREQSLLSEFNRINEQLLSIFQSTKNDPSRREIPYLMDQITALKNRKSEIISLLKPKKEM